MQMAMHSARAVFLQAPAVCLSVGSSCLSVCRFQLSVCLQVPAVCLSAGSSCLSVCLSVCWFQLSVCLQVSSCLSVCLHNTVSLPTRQMYDAWSRTLASSFNEIGVPLTLFFDEGVRQIDIHVIPSPSDIDERKKHAPRPLTRNL